MHSLHHAQLFVPILRINHSAIVCYHVSLLLTHASNLRLLCWYSARVLCFAPTRRCIVNAADTLSVHIIKIRLTKDKLNGPAQ